jgi:predicted RNA-binding protein with EMAP domain
MLRNIKLIVQNLSYNELETWYERLNNKKTFKGLTETQRKIHKMLEDRLWFDYRV